MNNNNNASNSAAPGAGKGTRTLTLLAGEPKSPESANSTIPAFMKNEDS